MTPDNWRLDAACAGANPDLFFAESSTGIAEAKAICATCPVTTACVTAALTEESDRSAAHRFGVRGGLTPRERARLTDRKARRP